MRDTNRASAVCALLWPVYLLLAVSMLGVPLVCRATEVVPELRRGHEGWWDVGSGYHRVGPALVSPTPPGPYLPADSLELIRIGWAHGGGGGLLITGDTDQDSLWELLTNIPYHCYIFENDGYDNYILQQTLPYFIPWDTGDADGDGLPDIVAQSTFYAQLWESPTPHSHPSQLVWQSPYISNVFQESRIVDLDQDGKNEILLARNGLGGGYGDVVIFECVGDNSFEYVYGSHATGENLGYSAVGDFDDDGWTEFAVGDTDGRVFVYECTGDDSYHQVAILSTGVWNSYYAVEARDMDGNGRWEFVVGGDISGGGGNKYTIFEAVGNNTYAVVDSVRIINGWHGHAYCDAGDIDGDSTEEFVGSNYGELRVYKAIDVGTYVPVAYYPQPPDTLLASLHADDLNLNGYAEIVWAGMDPFETLILEDRLAYGEFMLGFATNGTIIPQGGTLSYDGMLVNLEATPETVDVWTEVLLPGGEPFARNPVLGPIRVTLAPNDTLIAHPSRHIPMAAPLGEYTYMGFVSSSYPLPILAADTLFFTVVEP